MAITTRAQLQKALQTTSQRLSWQKASVPSQTTGVATSLWRSATTPAAGAIPPYAKTIHNGSSTGAFAFDADIPGMDRYLVAAHSLVATAGAGVMLYDRLMSWGGMTGTEGVYWQWIGGMDLQGVTQDNMVERVGRDDFSDVQWFLEWYTTTGSTPVNLDLSYVTKDWYTYPQIVPYMSLPASVSAQRLYPLSGINDEPIMGIDAIRLSASTGTAGNFGVTAMRPLCMLPSYLTQSVYEHDWQTMPMIKIPKNACVQAVVWPSNANTGIVSGHIEVVQG